MAIQLHWSHAMMGQQTGIQPKIFYLQFLGYDIDREAPDHSVLSKARARWGVEAFRGFFE
jgi:hypothetical protein